MTTEYTGEEFRPIFNAAWWAGNCEGVCPMKNWQSKPVGQTIWYKTEQSEPPCEIGIIYRFKPAPKRMVTIGYATAAHSYANWKTLVTPEIGSPFFYIDSAQATFKWDGNKSQKKCLNNGEVFLTYEDAQAMDGWTSKCRGGAA